MTLTIKNGNETIDVYSVIVIDRMGKWIAAISESKGGVIREVMRLGPYQDVLTALHETTEELETLATTPKP